MARRSTRSLTLPACRTLRARAAASREGGDPRTPDIIVLPNVGVVYTGSLKKQSEHGGFAWDDTNVMILVSNPEFERRTIHSFVETTQVAPTILKFLGLDPDDLDAVRKEGTPGPAGSGLRRRRGSLVKAQFSSHREVVPK